MYFALLRHLLEVHYDSRLTRFDRILHRVSHQACACRGIRQHLCHFLDAPILPVIIVQHTHDGKLHIRRTHPLVEFVFADDGDCFSGRGSDRLIAFVVHDGQSAIGRDGVQFFRNHQVQVLIMFFQRGETVGIVAYIEGSAQRIITCRNSSDVRHAPVAPFSLRHGLSVLELDFNRPVR